MNIWTTILSLGAIVPATISILSFLGYVFPGDVRAQTIAGLVTLADFVILVTHSARAASRARGRCLEAACKDLFALRRGMQAVSSWQLIASTLRGNVEQLNACIEPFSKALGEIGRGELFRPALRQLVAYGPTTIDGAVEMIVLRHAGKGDHDEQTRAFHQEQHERFAHEVIAREEPLLISLRENRIYELEKGETSGCPEWRRTEEHATQQEIPKALRKCTFLVCPIEISNAEDRIAVPVIVVAERGRGRSFSGHDYRKACLLGESFAELVGASQQAKNQP